MKRESGAGVKPVAEVRDLRVEIDGRAIVDGVSFRVLPGRVTALVGASGSGKTTTGLALLGEYPGGARVSGEVRVTAGGAVGRTTGGPVGRTGEPVGYVPQHPASVLAPARRVDALLTDIARPQVRHVRSGKRRAAARELVVRALEDAQLADAEAVLRRYPHQLSGGQQQRVVLAQALLLGAQIVVADEPTTGQDALTKRRVVEQLAALAGRGIGVVLLSHDLDVVRALADEVVVMRAGRVVESGPVEQVWAAPRHPWTRELLDAEGGSTSFDGWGARSRRPVVRVRRLAARYRDGSRSASVVLRVPALDVHAGECLAVVGRSGSGKTTLARCLAGLHRDFEGDVRLDDTVLPRSLRRRTRGQLAGVQYVFQDAHAAFDAYRPVVQQVARTAVRLRAADAEAAEREAVRVLARLGLPEDLVRRRPSRLSGGELQRAALARALLARPRVLLCDEITSGLDVVTRKEILATLADVVREQGDLALVLITHDLATAALAHRVAVLDAGEVVEEGPALEVLRSPRHPFTRSLVGTAEPAASP
ncbi:ATP-binding cassette domain-containing protein [Streptomyces cellulosae]|uniref:ATP-binding cassette domain-containing protein n=1 Tax=Streptomyces sp. Akac8 TaxID=2563106 RepID=UPI00048B9F69|nr:ATP-binding cassette domain-containing protein [Streptomyces cellulosae]WTF24320.1 ATP-binding cassette domain-containing protein [Streptomyces cellulosae]